jgi:hypothetical protein
MRFGGSMAAISVVATGFMVAGCSQVSSSGPGGGPPSSAASSASSSSGTAAGAGAGSEQTSVPASPAPSPGRPSGAAASPTAAAGSASAARCQPGDLSLAFGAKSGTTQVVLAVDLTNKGSSACTMRGFPGVDLIGATSSQQDYRWSLARQSASYSKVTLQPGQAAHFNLTYLPAAMGSGDNITVAKIVITPPNDLTQAQVSWNESVILQDGATSPGTYIGPVTAGA